jgi:4-aminobutyrate aminotransferase
VRWTPYVPPPEYWAAVRAACDKHGALLILDEIPNSLGRTGTFFTFEKFGIVPDMVVIGKGLGGGVLPIAALCEKRHLFLSAFPMFVPSLSWQNDRLYI